MTSNRFGILLLIRVAILLILISIIAWTGLDKKWLFTNAILLAVLLSLIWELLRFINRTNKDLSKFLDALKTNDFAVYFPTQKAGRLFSNLYGDFNTIINLYKRAQLETETHKEFLNIAVNRLQIGIIAYDEVGKLLIFNDYAQKTLRISPPRDWEVLLLRKHELVLAMDKMRAGETLLRELKMVDRTANLAVHLEEVVIVNQKVRILTFQDIRNELEQKEIESWHKLIRVLTHEIMNSLTPVISLTETAKNLLIEEVALMAPNAESLVIEDIKNALQTAGSRSKGLLDFVRNYRKLLKVPIPSTSDIELKAFCQEIQQLFAAELVLNGIALKTQIPTIPITFKADQHLLEQVFINLLKNAIEALENVENPQINFSVKLEDKGLIFLVKDNGPGIPEKVLPNIFVPFFTTKSEGSGIGLSLSRQIVRAHGGQLTVESHRGEGCEVRVEVGNVKWKM